MRKSNSCLMEVPRQAELDRWASRGEGMTAAGLLVAALAHLSAFAAERSYDFYQPTVKHVTIHEGKLAEGHYAYNHMASVEWFDGRFHAVWGGHAETYKEGVPGQLDLWATSPDFQTWSSPQPLAHVGPNALARDPQCVQWQPNLLNFKDRQLWCVWSFNSTNPALDGLYLSTLETGSDTWKHRRIQRRQAVGERSCSLFASQNPVLLTSGRVLAPVTLNYRDPKHDAGGGHATNSIVCRWNACFFTDDDGATWHCSTPLSAIDDPEGQWEPFFYEQSDGRLRAYMRNFTKATPPGNQWRQTAVGTGSQKGEPVLFPDDPVLSFMETANCRPQVFRLPGSRYCLLQQDAAVNHRDYQTRVNVALHFSRSGADDFVAAWPVCRPGVLSAYPQGVAHGNNLYLAYTVGPGDQPRSIEGTIVTPAPKHDHYYVWPRSKELVKLQDTKDEAGQKKVFRANPDARTALPVRMKSDGRETVRFCARASAGVDLDPLDYTSGHALNLRFETKIQRLQTVGMLIFCSFGDRIPIRLGMPANRPNRLYAYTRNQWEPVADFATNQWHSLAVTVRSVDFSVTADSVPSKTFPNPLVNPAPRLYLGDGFEVDYLNSNSGSEFLVDLPSLKTEITP